MIAHAARAGRDRGSRTAGPCASARGLKQRRRSKSVTAMVRLTTARFDLPRRMALSPSRQIRKSRPNPPRFPRSIPLTRLDLSNRWLRVTDSGRPSRVPNFFVAEPFKAARLLAAARRRPRFGGRRLVGKPRQEPSIGFGGIGPLIESLINFSRFQQSGRLPAGGLVEDVDLEKIAESLVELLLMEVSFPMHQERAGAQVSLTARNRSRAQTRPGLLRIVPAR